MDFVRIPNLSPAYERDWAATGHADAAAELLARSVAELAAHWTDRGLPCGDISVEILGGRAAPLHDPAGARRTPALLAEIPAHGEYAGRDTVLIYGHMDKQPEMKPWSAGLGPRSPVARDGKLYGRGAADDGYALFSALCALAALREQGCAHARVLLLVEGREESDGEDIAYYLNTLEKRLGAVSLITCLDSGAGDYQRLWLTTSLRGLVGGVLEISVLDGPVHSGAASGIVPSPLRVLRILLSRLEDEKNGMIKPSAFRTAIPKDVRLEAKKAAAVLGAGVYSHFPFVAGACPVEVDGARLLLNRSWRSRLSIVGLSGFPEARGAGNVTLPRLEAKLSLRLPPTLDCRQAADALKTLLEADPPYGVRVGFNAEACMAGWRAPGQSAWLRGAVNRASRTFFGNQAASFGEGGSIDFMRTLSQACPHAQMLVTGVLGPHSNAHGADESLDLNAAGKLSMCLAHILAAHAHRAA
jgi:acetylornithine deacetylase/succinyl-diaminopimelate desuccinylase-like protein